jgi:predicted ABC-type ATPase
VAANPQPLLIVLAGPNGAGKTTFFDEYLQPLGLPYVNADRLARALRTTPSPGGEDDIDRRAFDEAERLRAAFVEAHISFCTETVLSDQVGAKLRFLRDARAAGFVVVLIFIGLDSSVLSVARVTQRVRAGGHDIPDDKLHARFPRTLHNLRAAMSTVSHAVLFDNSSDDHPYRVVAVYEDGRLATQHPPLPVWTNGLPGL